MVSVGLMEDVYKRQVYHPDKKFVMGVQWHPEILGLSNSISSRIFEAFIDACTCLLYTSIRKTAIVNIFRNISFICNGYIDRFFFYGNLFTIKIPT